MSIKEKLEKYEFLLENSPCILDMNNRRVLINKEAPNPNEQASFENYNSYWKEARIVTQKLKVESYGNWDLSVTMVNTKHFENRQNLDRLFLAQFGIEAEPKQFGFREFLSEMRYRCAELRSAVKWTFICSMKTKSKMI